MKRISTIEVCALDGIKRIAVVGGGMSIEREISLISSKSIIASLIRLGYAVTFIDMGHDIAEALNQVKPGLVFNALHRTYGEDGCLQGLLNIMQIPYTHSGLLASALAMNKFKTYEMCKLYDIDVSDAVLVHKNDSLLVDPLPRPYITKPLSQGSSLGVVAVFPEDDFKFTEYDFMNNDLVMVEKYVAGREIQVAVLDGLALGTLEIVLLKSRFYDYQAKYTQGFVDRLCPARLPIETERRIMSSAEKIYSVIGCSGIARVEFIYSDASDSFIFLEINTHPGFTDLSICSRIAAHKGISFDELVQRIVNTAKYEA